MITSAIEQLRQHSPLCLVGACLADADLSGWKVVDCSLMGADLSGANLRGAHLMRVDLRLTNLQDACLEGAKLQMVTATGANLKRVKANHIRMRHVELFEADLREAEFSRAMLNTCTLEKADMSDCNLSQSYLVYSVCAGARFTRAWMEGLTALGSTFFDADFCGARKFSFCNEIVAEVLRREAGGDFQRVMECAAIVADRNRCYAEWKDYAAQHPDAEAFAFRVFEHFPESGCIEALRDGRGPSSVLGAS